MGIDDSSTTDQLVAAIEEGDDRAREELFGRHRPFLKQVVAVRLEPALRRRVDASDIVQDTLAAASGRLEAFVRDRPVSVRVWLRRNAMERLIDARRRHLADRRDARREVVVTDASSMAIANTLLHQNMLDTLQRRELTARVREAIAGLAEADREVILLRHAEGLTNQEAAEVLGVEWGTASKRYGRALARLSAELRKLGIQSL